MIDGREIRNDMIGHILAGIVLFLLAQKTGHWLFWGLFALNVLLFIGWVLLVVSVAADIWLIAQERNRHVFDVENVRKYE